MQIAVRSPYFWLSSATRLSMPECLACTSLTETAYFSAARRRARASPLGNQVSVISGTVFLKATPYIPRLESVTMAVRFAIFLIAESRRFVFYSSRSLSYGLRTSIALYATSGKPCPPPLQCCGEPIIQSEKGRQNQVFGWGETASRMLFSTVLITSPSYQDHYRLPCSCSP